MGCDLFFQWVFGTMAVVVGIAWVRMVWVVIRDRGKHGGGLPK